MTDAAGQGNAGPRASGAWTSGQLKPGQLKPGAWKSGLGEPGTASERLGVGRGAAVVSSCLLPVCCVAVLLWPSLWNLYPIVFADTGTYLSQAMHGYLGWDRPVFYGPSN
jgi:hypothetical protein